MFELPIQQLNLVERDLILTRGLFLDRDQPARFATSSEQCLRVEGTKSVDAEDPRADARPSQPFRRLQSHTEDATRGGQRNVASLPQRADRAECEPLGLTARDFEAEALAVIHCVGDLSVVSCAWQHLFRVWLPASGYQPANAPAFEVFARTPEEIGWETFDLYACLPIVRL